MTDRSVVVRLRAEIAGFRRAMADAADSVRRVGGAGEDAGERTTSLLDRITQSASENEAAWQQVGKTMLVVGGAIGAGVGLAVAKFADFDQQMSLVRAVSGASADEMQRLSAAALQAGADTKFSASEAAQATGELAKVGISTSDILGGALIGSLNLAAAGNLDLAQAAEISGQAMKLFNLAGKDVPHIADALAAGANKSAADVTDLAQALSQGGLVAAQTGLTLDQTVGTLSAFADNALMGSDAGTSFKTMLQRLNPQSKEAQQLMDQLGLSAYDAQGNFIGITAYAGKLQGALSKMSVEQRNAAMQTLFGSDAVRAATVLYNLGAKGVQEYVDAVNDQGAAARVAAINMDNLAGDVEQLKGSLETLLIQGGSAGNGPLRELVQGITSVVNAIGSLPQPVLDVGFGLSAFAAAALLAGGAALTMIPKVVELKASLDALGVSAARTSAALKGVGWAGLVVAVAAVSGEILRLSARAQVADVNISELADSLDSISRGSKQAGAFGDLFDNSGIGPFKHEVETTSEALQKFADSAQQAVGTNFGDRIERWGGPSEKFNKRVGEIDAAMAQMVKSGNIQGAAQLYDQLMESIDRANKAGANIPVDKVAEKFTLYQQALDAAKESQKQTAVEADGLGGAINGVQVSAKDAADAVDKLVQSLADAGLVQLSTRDAARQFEQSLDDVTAAIKANGTSMDINTEKGRKNQETLDNVAQAAIRKAQATYDSTKATEGTGPAEDAFRASLLKSRQTLIKQAERFGMTRKEAERYADQVLNIPAVKKTEVTLTGAKAAITEASRIAEAIARIPGRKTIDVVTRKIGAQAGHLMASGGLVVGPGGPRDDAVPAMLSNGEFVVNAAATARHRPLLEHLNGRKFADGGYVQHFAKGGTVKVKKKPVDPLIALRSQYGRYLDTDIVGALIGAPDAVVSEAVQRINSAFDKVSAITEKLAKSHKTTAARLEKDAASAERAMAKLADKRDALVERLKDATDKLTDLQRQYDDYAGQVASRSAGKGALDGLFFGRDSDGNEFQRTWQDVVAAMQQTVMDTKAFTDQVDQLRQAGLDRSLIEQIVGSDDGAAIAKAILEGGSQAVAQLNATAASLTQASQALGRQAADSLYGAGVQAAKGLVDGLASQQKAIEAQMVKIAEGIQKAIRKALDMHSPSRKMFALGELAGSSVGAGLGASVRGVEAQASRLAVAMVPAGRVAAAMAPTGSAARSGAGAAFPSVLEVRDVDGALVGRMRVEGQRVVDAHDRAVLSLGVGS